jgi:hypothetical protein
MAGYSRTPLPRKLGITDDHVDFLDRVPNYVAWATSVTRTWYAACRGRWT